MYIHFYLLFTNTSVHPRVAHLLNLMCCVLFVFLLFLDCLFCVAPLVFSNVSPPYCSPFKLSVLCFLILFVIVVFIDTSVVCLLGLSILCCPFCFLKRFTPYSSPFKLSVLCFFNFVCHSCASCYY